MTDAAATQLTSDDVLHIRDIVSHAYDAEDEYVKLNMDTFEPHEVNAALATLVTLGNAQNEASKLWMDIMWRQRNGYQPA